MTFSRAILKRRQARMSGYYVRKTFHIQSKDQEFIAD
jgi:hypothetical protein